VRRAVPAAQAEQRRLWRRRCLENHRSEEGLMKRVLFILVFVVFTASLLTGVTEVRPGERAVVRRFGRVLDEKPKPGLWIGLPWGIDRVDRVPVDLARRLLVGYQPDGQDNVQTPPGQL